MFSLAILHFLTLQAGRSRMWLKLRWFVACCSEGEKQGPLYPLYSIRSHGHPMISLNRSRAFLTLSYFSLKVPI